MSAKLIASIFTILLNLGIGVMVFFVLVIAMNGYSESDATYGFISFILLGFLVTVLMSVAAFLTVGAFTKRKYSGPASALIAIGIFTVIGAISKAVCGIIGVGIAELVRVNF